MLKNVIRDGREVDNIEEEGNVRVALETAVTRELARIDLAHVHERIQVLNQVPGLHVWRASWHTTGTSAAGPALGAQRAFFFCALGGTGAM